MLRTTVGQLLVNNALPSDMRRYDRVLDKKGTRELYQELAEKHPDEYREVAKKLSDIGRQVAAATGGYSFGIRHLRASLAAKKVRAELGNKLQQIYRDPTLSDDARDQAIIAAAGAYQKTLPDEVFEEAKKEGNPLAYQIMSGARGNKSNLNSLLGNDLLYEDHTGKALPIPVLRSYAQGLRPFEFFAGAFGARKGLLDLKSSTARAGFFGKQLIQAAHRLLVTAKDDDQPYDETTPRGFPADTDDPDNAGALLAHPVGRYKRNTILTPGILKELKAAGQETILVRSPTVGGPKDGGVYGYDAGVRERGGIAPRGDYIGIAASQSLSEPLTQSMLSSKHSGGVAGASAGAIGGFKAINSLVQIPKVFPGGATHAQLDGTVHSVREAPQGGTYVKIGNEEHYVRQGLPLLVKPGQEVEAGDPISEGQWNPAEITKHKHIGEGRRTFTRLFRQTFQNSGISGHRRNIELLARGLINHVRLTQEVGPHVPDDIIPYQTLEAAWQPRAGAVTDVPKRSLGRYLERPVLHYTIGTRVRPSVLKELAKFNVGQIMTHPSPPPFEPEMIRGMANVTHDPDPITRMLGSYQQSSMLDAVHRGATSDEAGASYVPAAARRVDFGRQGLTQGWKPTP